jgi:hypothetical protein
MIVGVIMVVRPIAITLGLFFGVTTPLPIRVPIALIIRSRVIAVGIPAILIVASRILATRIQFTFVI